MSANMLSGAAYLELGLAAARDGDNVRAAACFASIDTETWDILKDRFTGPQVAWLIQLLDDGQFATKMAALIAGETPALEAGAIVAAAVQAVTGSTR